MSAGSRPLSPSETSGAFGYLALFWRADVAVPPRLDGLKPALSTHAPRLIPVLSRPGLMVFGDADDPKWSVSVDRGQTLALIGAAFDRESLSEEGAERAGPDRLAGLDDRALLQSAWGSFVAIRRRIGPPYVSILRDPSGALPALVADGAGFAVAAPDLPRWLRDALGIDPAIDMTKLALALANPLLPTHQALLAGVHQLPAGCALDWDGDKMGKARMLWAEPTALSDPVPDDPGAPGRMRRAVAGCVRALASPHRRLTLELSGGLDSAIVLGALASAPDPVEVSCVNFAVGHAGGDERSEARAVADRWKVRLVEVGAEAQDLCFGDLFAGEQPVEPILYGPDPILERASIGVARAFDTTAIFTGQGGDAVFCNLPTPLVAVDYARAAGWRALVSRIAYDAARRAHCSIWQVQRLMLRDRLASTRSDPQQLPGMQLGDATQRYGDATMLLHPWLDAQSAMAPARRMQFEAIANCQHFNSPTWRAAATALVHPLLTQPIVEACLAIPTYRLAHGAGNRALARELFADWLPDIVRTRRDKGDATNYYRRAVVENLPYLRDFLLNGTLVAHGLLDGDGIDAALRDESLIWSYESRLIVVYASFEAWARYWGLAPGGT